MQEETLQIDWKSKLLGEVNIFWVTFSTRFAKTSLLPETDLTNWGDFENESKIIE